MGGAANTLTSKPAGALMPARISLTASALTVTGPRGGTVGTSAGREGGWGCWAKMYVAAAAARTSAICNRFGFSDMCNTLSQNPLSVRVPPFPECPGKRSEPGLRACNKTQIANPSGGCLHADYSTPRDYSGPIGLQPTAIDLIMKARP